MDVIDEITERLDKLRRINDRLIVLSDIYVTVEKKVERSKNKQKYIVREKRNVIVKDILYELKPGPENIKYFNSQMERKVNLHEKETMVIDKIVLKREIGCSVYPL